MSDDAGTPAPEADKMPPSAADTAAEAQPSNAPASSTAPPPARHVLFDKPFLLLSYDTRNQWLHAQWRGHLTLEKVREGSEKVLEVVRASRYRRLLNDNTAVLCLDLTEEEQQGYQIMDLLFEAGLHYLAWVYAPVPQGRSYAENSIAVTGWPLILSFEECGPACDWLRQAPQRL